MQKYSQRGLTLLELVIAIGMLVALAGIAVDLLSRARAESASQMTLERMGKIADALHLYSADTIKCRMGGLAALDSSNDDYTNHLGIPMPKVVGGTNVKDFIQVANGSNLPVNGSNLPVYVGTTPPPVHENPMSCWAGPYLPIDLNDSLYLDGWGNPIKYKWPGLPGLRPFVQATALLMSDGPDRAAGTADDILMLLDFSKEFHAEAKERENAINAAIKNYISNPVTPPVTPGLIDVSDDPALVANSGYLPYEDLHDFLVVKKKLLPEDPRYKTSPWSLIDSSLYGNRNTAYTFSSFYPSGEVFYLYPMEGP